MPDRVELVGVEQPSRARLIGFSALALRAALEAPGFVAGFFAVMREPLKEHGGHFSVAEDGGPFIERDVGGDDDRGPVVEPTDQVEEELAAGLGARKVAKFVEHDEVEPREMIGDESLLSGAMFSLKPVDQISDIKEAAPRALTACGRAKIESPRTSRHSLHLLRLSIQQTHKMNVYLVTDITIVNIDSRNRNIPPINYTLKPVAMKQCSRCIAYSDTWLIRVKKYVGENYAIKLSFVAEQHPGPEAG